MCYRFGDKGSEIASKICQRGRCPYKDLAEICTDEDSRTVFNVMFQQGYVQKVGSDDSVSMLDKRLSQEQADMPKTALMSTAELKKYKNSLKSGDTEFDSSVATGSKRKAVQKFSGGFKLIKLVDFDEEGNESTYWKLNFAKIDVGMQQEKIADMAETRINSTAKDVMRRFFAATQGLPGNVDGSTAPVTMTTLSSKISVGLGEEHTAISADELKDSISLLVMDEIPFLSKVDDKAGGQYAANIKSISMAIKQCLIEDYVRERMGSVGCRVWRLLNIKGMLSEKDVSKLALVSNKTARSNLYELMQHGVAFLQDVPRTVDHAPSRTFFLWYVSIPKCVTSLIEESYAALVKLKIRRGKVLKDHASLLEKLQRSDVKEDQN
ncbi:RNA polymerase III subunit C82 [Blyttiomyces sp. JEL0837]|nr:RNA polymerase III subunit C82 [Blyttiomyces sp. JEL0837]